MAMRRWRKNCDYHAADLKCSEIFISIKSNYTLTLVFCDYCLNKCNFPWLNRVQHTF
jgi:hypothetical protein